MNKTTLFILSVIRIRGYFTALSGSGVFYPNSSSSAFPPCFGVWPAAIKSWIAYYDARKRGADTADLTYCWQLAVRCSLFLACHLLFMIDTRMRTISNFQCLFLK